MIHSKNNPICFFFSHAFHFNYIVLTYFKVLFRECSHTSPCPQWGLQSYFAICICFRFNWKPINLLSLCFWSVEEYCSMQTVGKIYMERCSLPHCASVWSIIFSSGFYCSRSYFLALTLSLYDLKEK